jgi:hypothetical protein
LSVVVARVALYAKSVGLRGKRKGERENAKTIDVTDSFRMTIQND